MPITYHIDAARNLVVTHAVGVLTDADILEHKRRLSADPRFTSDLHELSDVRGITDLRVTPEGVRAMTVRDAHYAPHRVPQKLAIVACEDLVFGMARMYETLTERNTPNVRVFRDYSEAVRWVGAPVPPDVDL